IRDFHVTGVQTCAPPIYSRALALANISAETPDPQSGRIERDEQGNPTGFMADEPCRWVKAGPTAPPTAAPDGAELVRSAQAALTIGRASGRERAWRAAER